MEVNNVKSQYKNRDIIKCEILHRFHTKKKLQIYNEFVLG